MGQDTGHVMELIVLAEDNGIMPKTFIKQLTNVLR